VYAVTLGETKPLLLAKTLEEEKNADVKLTEIAVSHINVDAAHESHK
jgi:ferritin-like metal-binding protein YciE